MIRNYLKITFRQLWRNRLFATINVVGLSIGIAACWIIFQMVSYEFSFDANHPNGDRIYKVVSWFNSDGKESGNAGVPRPMAEAIRKEIAGIEKVVGVYGRYISKIQIPQPTGKSLSFEEVDKVVATTPEYFEIVPYQWLAGVQADALIKPNQVVLTEKRANQYFPNQTPAKVVGKTMIYWDTLAVEVVGVVANPIQNTSFTDLEFISLPTIMIGDQKKEFLEAWGSTNSDDQTYILVAPNVNVANLKKQINILSNKYGEAEMKKWGNAKRKHELLVLKDIHLKPEYGGRNRTANKQVLYGLMGLAVFLLLLAIINYVNLATAQIPYRAKEIGVGSSRWHLIMSFLGETIILTLIASILAFGLTELFKVSFKELLPEGIELYKNAGQMLLFALLLIIVVAIVSGWYPSLLITKFQPVQVLRGQVRFSVGKSSFTLRKSLIVFQFVVAQIFIIGALIWNQQLHYALTADLGFDREAILTLQVPWKYMSYNNPAYSGKSAVLQQQLQKLPEIASVSLGDAPFEMSFSSNTHRYKSKKGEIDRDLYRKRVDTAYINLYGMELLAGNNLTVSDTTNAYILNETAVKEYGFVSPQEAIGKYLYENDGDGYKKGIPIVGVVKDFHSATFSQKINPTALLTEKDIHSFSVKLASKNPADWQKAIEKIKKAWSNYYPIADFRYEFYDDMIENFYQSERIMARTVNLATAIAILISCLGLFGLATLMAFQRTKEIGIRKVMGASVASIVQLLSKDFIKLVLVALVVASPVAYYLMDKYLQNYAYRIDIEWYIFVGTALLAVLIALVTVSYQALKAALMNPVKSLRSE